MSSQPPSRSPALPPIPLTPLSTPSTLSSSPTLPFIRGGLAGCLSWLLIHPADVIKVRMQLPHTPHSSALSALRTISQTEGVSALYNGLSAALTRQITYTTLRLGIYQSLRDRKPQPPTLFEKFLYGTIAGGISSFLSTPVEVCMVRLYSRSGNYRHVGDALIRIAKEEGIRGLWSGCTPTVVRSCVANCVQLGVYDQAKEVYQPWMEGVRLHIAASITSGFWYSFVTMPIDVAKTRLQNKRGRYTGLGNVLVSVAREEGVTRLWRGFWPYFGRCAGHTVAMFVVLEQVKRVI